MERKYKILFVDDDDRFAKPFLDRVYNEYNIELIHKQNWEEAISSLDGNYNDFDALIIDGKGQLTKDSKADDSHHVLKAISDLKERQGRGKYIPYAVFSKYFELKELFNDYEFYEKNKDEDALFKYLINQIENRDVEKIIIRFPEVFECFGDKYLPSDAKQLLIGVLINIENNSWSDSTFTSLRKVIEAIYKKLHKIDDILIPYCCIKYEKDNINFDFCARRLFSGKDIRDNNNTLIVKSTPKVIPEHLGWLIHPLDKVCSICSHDYKDSKFVNIYSLKTIAYGVMEFIIWFKKFVDENYYSKNLI